MRLSCLEAKQDYKGLIKSIFPNLPTGNVIVIRVKSPNVLAELRDENNNVLFSGTSKCNPEDRWDEYTGVTLALTRLRINVNSYVQKKSGENVKKVWVPKLGEKYYDACFEESSKVFIEESVWTDSLFDFVQLSDGNVFRTEREAKKHLKRSMFNGRKIAKENRKHG